MDGMRKFLVIIPLLALLAAAVWFALYAWTAIEGPPMPVEGMWRCGSASCSRSWSAAA